MDNEAAFEKFRECAVEVLQVPAEKVTMEARFAEDLDADSGTSTWSRRWSWPPRRAFDITVEESEGSRTSETAGQAFELISAKF